MVYNEMTDLIHLSWTLSRKSSGTAGSFLKSYEESKGIKYYYKLSNFDTVMGIDGHECINEMIGRFKYHINIFNPCRNHLPASKYEVFTELIIFIILSQTLI